MTDDKDKKEGGEQGEPRFTKRFDFSDLKDAHPTTAAFAYVERDWMLVPVDTRTGEVDLASGVAGASRDVETVLEWADEPGIVIGIATGRRSRVVALCCEGDLGQRALEMLQSRNEPFTTLEVNGRDSKFFLFRAPEEGLQSRGQIAPGLDFLGEREYFVPSQQSWSTLHTELALLPDWLHSLAAGTATLSRTDMAVAGVFEALNDATPYEAALAYRALNWKLVKIRGKAEPIPPPGKTRKPEVWNEDPTIGLGIVTGAEGGVVGLQVGSAFLHSLEEKHGRLPFPKFASAGWFHFYCFRAPQELFPSQKVSDGVKYFGESDFALMPPSAHEWGRLQWKVGGDSSPELPELPAWLHGMLSTKPNTSRAAQARPKGAKAAKQPGKGKRAPAPTKTLQQVPELSQLGAVALRLAEKGMFVFPIKPNEETPLFPKQGAEQATCDLITVSQWWKKNPDANIGLQTGHQSRIVVLEVDAQQGLATLDELEKAHGSLVTPRAETPSGGLQLFFLAPQQRVGSVVGLKPGLNFFGERGYVLLAPSRVGERMYRSLKPSPELGVLAGWLLDLVVASDKRDECSPSAAAIDLVEQLDKWIAARCEVGDTVSAKSSDLLEDFSSWRGEALTRPRFGELLRGKGYRSHKESSVWWYRGLRLKKGP